MPADYNVIDRFLSAYLNAIDSGFGLIKPDVLNVFGLLIVITIGITAVFWALDENNNVAAGLFRKTLQIGFFAWLIGDWAGLSKTVVLGFAQLGLQAGGAGVNVNTFLSSPSDLVYMGMKLVTDMTVQIKELSGPIAFFENFAIIFVISLAVLGVIIAFVILAVQVFVTIIEFRLVTLAAFILIPFGIMKQTSFLSDRALGYVASSGLKVLTLALIVSIGSRTFEQLSVGNVPSIEASISILIASVVLVMLALTVPSIAAALVTGGPQLGAGAALGGVAGIAAGAGAAYLGARGAAAAPGAIASKAKAAANFLSGGGGAAPGGGGGAPGGGGNNPSSGGPAMQPANPQGSESAASVVGGNAPTGAGTTGGAPRAPTNAMANAAQSIAAKKGVDAPDMSDGNAVRDFLDQNTEKQLGTYDRAAAANGTSAAANDASADPSGTATAAPAMGAAMAAAVTTAPVASAVPASAPTTAPSAASTVKQLSRRQAQTAMAVSRAQGGAGMSANIAIDDIDER